MREIKFRAWFEGHMYEIAKLDFWGDPEQATCDMVRMSLTEDGYTEECEVYLHEVELMQYTGMKDKNGKEIYEGDIVTTDLERNYLIVEYRNGAFMLNCNDGLEDYYDIFFATSDEPTEIYKYGEVVGNIYENPEMLT